MKKKYYKARIQVLEDEVEKLQGQVDVQAHNLDVYLDISERYDRLVDALKIAGFYRYKEDS